MPLGRSTLVVVRTAFALLLALPSLAHADDFSDFRIPKNRGFLWTLDLGAQGTHERSEDQLADRSTGSLVGTTSSDALWFSDSDPAFTQFTGLVHFQGVRARNELDQHLDNGIQISTVETEGHDRTLLEHWSLSFEHRRYPGRPPLAIQLQLAGQGDYRQIWQENEDVSTVQIPPSAAQRQTEQRSQELWHYREAFQAGAGLGAGRVRNATSIYDAIVLEQRLQEAGALTRPLSPAARRRLAEWLYARGGYDFVNERPARVVWQEIERILADDGALSDRGLDAYSILRAAEPHIGSGGPSAADGVPISPVRRMTGAFVGVRAEYEHFHELFRTDVDLFDQTAVDDSVVSESRFHVATHEDHDDDVVNGVLVAEYHRPLGVQWQLDGSGVLRVPVTEDDNSLEVSSMFALSWLIADRWLASTSLRQYWLDADRTSSATYGDSNQWTYLLGINYYIENHLALTLSGGVRHVDIRVNPLFSGGSDQFLQDDQVVSLGMTYRFSGWFEAPGLLPATPPLR